LIDVKSESENIVGKTSSGAMRESPNTCWSLITMLPIFICYGSGMHSAELHLVDLLM